MTICLALISNEPKDFLLRAIRSARPLVDTYVLSLQPGDPLLDSDLKDEIKQTCGDLSGDVIVHPWVNYGTNRNHALEAAEKKADAVLMFDADDVLSFSEGTSLHPLKASCYQFMAKLGSYEWPMVGNVFRSSDSWRFRGAVHEFPVSRSCGSVVQRHDIKVLVTRDDSDGHEKYKGHAKLLEKELRNDPTNTRSAFYLAQSYRDAGMKERAIEAYLHRATMPGGYRDERFQSLLWVARIERDLRSKSQQERDWDSVLVPMFLKAHQADPRRAEPLADLAWWYHQKDDHGMAMLYAGRAYQLVKPVGALFLETHTYDYLVPDLVAIHAGYIGEHRLGKKAAQELHEQHPEDERLKRNLGFYLDNPGV